MSNYEQLNLCELKSELTANGVPEKEIERLCKDLPPYYTGSIGFTPFYSDEGRFLGFQMTKWVPYHCEPSN